MKNFIILMIINFICFSSFTQPTKKDYETKTIVDFNGGYQKGIKILSFSEMIAEINLASPEGAMFAKDAAKDIKTAKILRGFSMLLNVGTLVYVYSNPNGFNPNIALGLSVGTLVPSFFSLKYQTAGKRKLGRAIWLHNRDVLF